jgi:hypothetical protein
MGAREQYEAKKAEAQKKKDECRPIPLWWLGQRDPIARFTLYVAAFTFALFGVGVLQYKILKQADDTSRLRDRAFASVDGLEVRPQKQGDNVLRWRIDPIITNNGVTPTGQMVMTNTEVHFPDVFENFLQLWPTDTEPYDPEDFVGRKKLGGLEPQEVTLAPKQTLRGKGYWMPHSMVEKKAAKPDLRRLFMIGVIHYRDIYEAPDDPAASPNTASRLELMPQSPIPLHLSTSSALAGIAQMRSVKTKRLATHCQPHR